MEQKGSYIKFKAVLLCIILLTLCLGCSIQQDPSTALSRACRRGDTNRVTAILKKHPALAKTACGTGWTALHDAALAGQTKVIIVLLRAGVDINAKTETGETALHMALENQKFDTAKFLILSGADVNIMNDSGFTPLHWAVMSKNIDLVKLLVSRGANVNANAADSDKPPITPLVMAAGSERKQIATYLKQHGAK